MGREASHPPFVLTLIRKSLELACRLAPFPCYLEIVWPSGNGKKKEVRNRFSNPPRPQRRSP